MVFEIGKENEGLGSNHAVVGWNVRSDIEAFNKQFKAWYKTKQGFNSFDSASSMIMMFVYFFNFIRPHSSLSNLTPAQVAGCNYSERQQNSLLLVS